MLAWRPGSDVEFGWRSGETSNHVQGGGGAHSRTDAMVLSLSLYLFLSLSLSLFPSLSLSLLSPLSLSFPPPLSFSSPLFSLPLPLCHFAIPFIPPTGQAYLPAFAGFTDETR